MQNSKKPNKTQKKHFFTAVIQYLWGVLVLTKDLDMGVQGIAAKNSKCHQIRVDYLRTNILISK